MAGFIKKNWQKDATKNATNALLRAAGAGGAAMIATKFFKEDGTNTKTTLANIGGPLLLAVGVLGDLMLENEMARSACQGVATYAALHSIAKISPNFQEATGISGVEENTMLGETYITSNMLGENTANELPEEFEEITTVDDGNDWNTVAEDIEQGAEEAVQVAGVEDEQDTEEIKQMMGMF